MLFGSPVDAVDAVDPPPPPRSGAATAPLVTGLVALALLGVFAWPLGRLLQSAAVIAGTG